MSDSKVSALTPITAPNDADLGYIVHAGVGNSISRANYLGGLTISATNGVLVPARTGSAQGFQSLNGATPYSIICASGAAVTVNPDSGWQFVRLGAQAGSAGVLFSNGGSGTTAGARGLYESGPDDNFGQDIVFFGSDTLNNAIFGANFDGNAQSYNNHIVHQSGCATIIYEGTTANVMIVSGVLAVRSGTTADYPQVTVGGTLFNHQSDIGNTHFTPSSIEDDLNVDILPANALASNGDQIVIDEVFALKHRATATTQVRQYAFGTAVYDSTSFTLTAADADLHTTVIITRTSSTAVRVESFAPQTAFGTTVAVAPAVADLSGLTLTGTNILKATALCAGTNSLANDVISKARTVRIFPAGLFNLRTVPLQLQPAFWYDPTRGTFQNNGFTAAVADTDPISFWTDQSINKIHGHQYLIGSQRPTLGVGFQPGGTNSNNLNVVKFSATGGPGSTPQYMKNVFPFTQPVHLFFVVYTTSLPGTTMTLFQGPNAGPSVNMGTFLQVFAGSDNLFVTSANAQAKWYVIEAFFDDATNGMQVATYPSELAVTTTINGATNASPIVISTSAGHGLTSAAGGRPVVRITGVTGNTAANGAWTVTVGDATHFTLVGSAGNGAYGSGGSFQQVGEAVDSGRGNTTNFNGYYLGTGVDGSNNLQNGCSFAFGDIMAFTRKLTHSEVDALVGVVTPANGYLRGSSRWNF
jgi:hypothetical protein